MPHNLLREGTCQSLSRYAPTGSIPVSRIAHRYNRRSERIFRLAAQPAWKIRGKCSHETATMIPVIVAELFDELAHGIIPRLPGAACRGHPELFDVAGQHDRDAIAQAKAVCHPCQVPRLAAQSAEAGAAVRGGRGPIRRTAQAAGVRAAAAGDSGSDSIVL